MSVFDNAIARLTNKINDIDTIIRIAIDQIIESPEFQFYITELNKEQMFQGIRSNKTKIGDKHPYKPVTIKRKEAKKQPTDRVTLKDTEAFYKSLKVKVAKDSFEVIATDSKAPKLIGKYDQEILGLTDENLNYVMALVKRELIKIMNKEFKR